MFILEIAMMSTSWTEGNRKCILNSKRALKGHFAWQHIFTLEIAMMWTHRVHKYRKYIWSVKGHSGSLQDIYVYRQWKLVRGLQCSCTLYYIAKLVWWTNPIDVIMIVHTQARKSWWTVAKMASLKLLTLLILLGLGYSRTGSSKQKPQNSTSVVHGCS